MENDNFIAAEMLTHPVLFTHPHAKKIALINNQDESMLQEILKHPNVTDVWNISEEKFSAAKNDPRVQLHIGNSADYFSKNKTESFDIIITLNPAYSVDLFRDYLSALNKDGILIQQCESFFDVSKLKLIQDDLRDAGFHNVQILTFPQPSYPSGWRAAVMAIKQGIFKRPSEKAIFNKPFNTRYYNFDVHKASFAIPEFIREQINS